MALRQPTNPKRLLVVLPNWVGDVVMATPMLRAVRKQLPDTHITAIGKRYVMPILSGCGDFDEPLEVEGDASIRRIARLIRAGGHDTAVLLTNSFRTALIVRLAGVKNRIGYARDGRGWLLTECVQPLKDGKKYTPISAIDYYLTLGKLLGADASDRTMSLAVRPEDQQRVEKILNDIQPTGPIVMLNPGAANLGTAKQWPPARYAAVADHLAETHNATVLLNGSPKERGLLDDVCKHASCQPVVLLDHDSDLNLLKAVCERCDLVISNDTGTRHVAVAMGPPTISLVGPTDPRWTDLRVGHETVIRSPQAPDYPMDAITTESVIEAADRVLQARTIGATGP